MYNTTAGDPVITVSKKKKVDSCADGQCAPTTRGMRSFSRFSPTKKRYNIPQGKKKVVQQPDAGGMHMNMRDLGDAPGQPSKNTDRNVAERKSSEVVLSKNRKFFQR